MKVQVATVSNHNLSITSRDQLSTNNKPSITSRDQLEFQQLLLRKDELITKLCEEVCYLNNQIVELNENKETNFIEEM